MRLIVDADSLIYGSCFNVENIEESKQKFIDRLELILARLSDFCEISDVVICNGSKKNFRTSVNKSYKANRTTEKPKYLNDLDNWVKEEFNSYFTTGYETDDVVATLWKESVEELGENNVIIASPDKDFRQFPCWLFDSYYRRMELLKIDDFEAKVNFYSQMIIGDTADNVKYLKGRGKAFAKKLFKGAKTEYSLIRRTYVEFINVFGDEAREKFLECYELLKLKTDVKSIQTLSS